MNRRGAENAEETQGISASPPRPLRLRGAVLAAALLSLAPGCNSLYYYVGGQAVVPLSEKDASALSHEREVDLAAQEPSLEGGRALLEPVAWSLAERGYRVSVVAFLSGKTARPLVLVDSEPAEEDEKLAPGLAARVALFLPGKDGSAYDWIGYLPWFHHPDDEEQQARHVRRAVEDALEPFPAAVPH